MREKIQDTSENILGDFFWEERTLQELPIKSKTFKQYGSLLSTHHKKTSGPSPYLCQQKLHELDFPPNEAIMKCDQESEKAK